jgi:hypothetical protein
MIIRFTDNMKPVDINPAYEAEIKKQLDAIWENRFRLSVNNVELLRRLANKTKL